MPARNPLNDLSLNDLGSGLGGYLREQRLSARMSVRQLSELAGISNPYLSQIERGLKKPSAEILGRLAKALEVSSETLYVQAGILEPGDGAGTVNPPTVRAAVMADDALTQRQKQTLLDIYESFTGSSTIPQASATRSTKAPRKR